MQIQCRQMQAEEFEVALQILKSAAQHLQDKKVDQWKHWLKPDKDKLLWLKEGFDKNEFYAVESSGHKIAGMFRLMDEDLLYWGQQHERARYIHSLVVKKEFAHLGLGNAILKYIESRVIKEGIKKLRLDCNAGNKWLCSYYEQQGFNKTGEVQMPHSLNNLYEKVLA